MTQKVVGELVEVALTTLLKKCATFPELANKILHEMDEGSDAYRWLIRQRVYVKNLDVPENCDNPHRQLIQGVKEALFFPDFPSVQKEVWVEFELEGQPVRYRVGYDKPLSKTGLLTKVFETPEQEALYLKHEGVNKE